jgi:hypothetical protein
MQKTRRDEQAELSLRPGPYASAETAIAQHADGRAMELWQGARFVAHFPADAKTSRLRG